MERILGVRAGTDGSSPFAESRLRAEALGATTGDEASERAGWLATLTFAAEVLAGVWVDREWSTTTIERTVEELSELLGLEAGIVRAALLARAVRDRHLLTLPPQLAAATVLDMLQVFTGASSWLWAKGQEGRLTEVGRSNERERAGRRARAAAQQAVDEGRPVTSPRSRVHALPVTRWGEPAAALVLRCPAELRGRALAFGFEAAVALTPVLEFDALLSRNAAREQTLTQAGERQLTRLGFDLHDGPMQDIAALAADVRLFRTQLADVLDGHPQTQVALGRVDDLEARLIGLDRDLRELARSLQSPAGLRLSLAEAVEHEVGEFRRRTGMDVELTSSGDFDALTASQKIALVRVVQEALSNAHEHSDARGVSVRVHSTRSRLRVEVEDDGHGFDVGQALLRAARAGRLGLVGMGERIRLLGGRFDVESTPGGPTRISATVPRWSPLTGDVDGRR